MLKFIKIQDPKDLKLVFGIRKKVFILEQNVNPHEEFDQFEATSEQFLVTKENLPIATCRIREIETGMKVERVAVLSEYRNKGVGRFLIGKILEIFKNSASQICYLYSQLDKIAFYQKFGFIEEGEIFLDADIPHKLMKLQK